MSRSLFGFLLLALLVVVLVWVPIIWLSVKAKPIGQLPYRWGTLMGLCMVLLALSAALFIPGSIRNANVIGAQALMVLVIAASLAAIGLLRRGRWGVVLYFVVLTILLLMGPVMDAVHNQHTTKPSESAPMLVNALINVLYFKKRWKFMARQKEAISQAGAA